MADKKKIKTTTRGGNPSICEWELKFSFKTKDQCEAFIANIFAMDMNRYPSFSFEEREIGGISHFVVSIESCWANNLVRFAEILVEVDHED